MALKLEKTFLSKKFRPGALAIALAGFFILLAIQFFDLNHLSPSGQLVFGKGEYWRAFTGQLLHADLGHLSHNAFFFTGLAFILNGYFGLWVFPLMSLAAGTLINLITIAFYPPEVTLVGISGVVYFMASFWLTIFILIERRQSLPKRFIYAIGMALIFFFPETFQRETSYLAHGVGFALGIPAAMAYFMVNFVQVRAHEVWVEKTTPVIDFEWEANAPTEESLQ